MTIKWIVPSVSRDLKDRMRREAYVTNEIIIRTELLKARGVDLKLLSNEDDEEPVIKKRKGKVGEVETTPFLQGQQSRSFTEYDGVNTGDVTDRKIIM